MQVIDLKNVSKAYRRKRSFKSFIKQESPTTITAVDKLTFSIEAGEIVGYLGANGAGKSTTIKMMSGILVPTDGTVSVFGKDPHSHRMQNNYIIGAVFGQRSQLIWDLPALDSFKLNAHIYGLEKQIYKKRLGEYVELLDAEKYIELPVRKLSLGQRMCCEIIASLLHDPKLIFLDEPTIGLDILNKEKILNTIQKLNESHHTTVFFTTHDITDVERICKRIIVIDQGKKVYDGSIQLLKEKYESSKLLHIKMTTCFPVGDISDILKIATCEIKNGCIDIHYHEQDISSINMVSMCMEKIHNIKEISTQEYSLEEILKHLYKGENKA